MPVSTRGRLKPDWDRKSRANLGLFAPVKITRRMSEVSEPTCQTQPRIQLIYFWCRAAARTGDSTVFTARFQGRGRNSRPNFVGDGDRSTPNFQSI